LRETRASFLARGHKPLETVFMDVWGPISTEGRGGEKYFLSIIDDFSRKTVVYPFRDKTQVFEIFKKHITRAERFLDKKLKFIRTDNGLEFDNQHFESYCGQTGVQHEFTNAYTPEQNGVCERFNQTALNNVRSILHSSGMPYKFWPDAAIYFAYTWNRVCHGGQTVTPTKLYSGNKPSVRHLKSFGTVCYIGIPKVKRRSKLDVKSKKGVMVGYGLKTKGYRIWLEDEGKIVETINVTFKEVVESSGLRRGAALGPFLESEEDEGEVTATFENQSPQTPFSRLPESETDDEIGTQGSLPLDDSVPSLRQVNWFRKPIPRRDGSRTDIYYFEDGKTDRLRSLNEIKSYCQKNQILYDPSVFNFSGNNNFRGIVSSDSQPSTSSISSHRGSR